MFRRFYPEKWRHVFPLLGNDREANNYTTVIARRMPSKNHPNRLERNSCTATEEQCCAANANMLVGE
jgi:hypothetical protein